LKKQKTAVKEYLIDNTKVKICNDYFINKSPEEVDELIQNCTQIACNCFNKTS